MALTSSTQSVARPGVIELSFGEPDPALFPAAGLADACRAALADGGGEALPYGANAGPAGLRRRVRRRRRIRNHRRKGNRCSLRGRKGRRLDLR